MPKKGKQKVSPGQQDLWEKARVEERTKVSEVTEKFIEANRYPGNPGKKA